MRTGFDALSAYNIFLEIAVESGIFALIAFLGFAVTMLVKGVKIILKSTDVKTVIFLSAAVISVSAVMVHGIFQTADSVCVLDYVRDYISRLQETKC